MNGIDLITAARARQLQPQAAATLLQRGATIGADLAGLLDDLALLQDLGLASTTAAAPAPIDLLNPLFVCLNADGAELPDREDAAAAHVATLYPQFGLIVDVRRAEGEAGWVQAGDKAKAVSICGSPSDGLLYAAEWNLIIDRRRTSGPMVNLKAFPNARTDRIYWTADPHPSDSGCASCVGLDGGYVDWYGRAYQGLAVACRRMSPRQ